MTSEILNVDDGLRAIRKELELSQETSQSFKFSKVALLLEGTVKIFSNTVDFLWQEAVDLKLGLLNGNFLRPDAVRKKSKRKICDGNGRNAVAEPPLEHVPVVFSHNIDMPSKNASQRKVDKLCGMDTMTLFGSRDRSTKCPTVWLLNLHCSGGSSRSRKSVRFENEPFDKYDMFLNDWCYQVEPLDVWNQNESKCFKDLERKCQLRKERKRQDLESSFQQKEEENSQLPKTGEETGSNQGHNKVVDGNESSDEELFDLYPVTDHGTEVPQETNVTQDQDSGYASILESVDTSIADDTNLVNVPPEVDMKDPEPKAQMPKREKRMEHIKHKKKKEKRPRFSFANLEDPTPKGRTSFSSSASSDKVLDKSVDDGFDDFLDYVGSFGLDNIESNDSKLNNIGSVPVGVPQRKGRSEPRHKGRKSNPNDESGICMKTYRNKIRAWFIHIQDPDGLLDFRDHLQGEPVREVSRHLLALLHLANEEEMELISKPLIMDSLLLRRLSTHQ